MEDPVVSDQYDAWITLKVTGFSFNYLTKIRQNSKERMLNSEAENSIVTLRTQKK